jgi:hypothetical protein
MYLAEMKAGCGAHTSIRAVSRYHTAMNLSGGAVSDVAPYRGHSSSDCRPLIAEHRLSEVVRTGACLLALLLW